MTDGSWTAAVIVTVYLGLMAAVAIRFRHFNEDLDQYLRAGGGAPWWLLGVSIFMQSFSAVTFTGVAAQAYSIGVSVGWIMWCNALICLVHGAGLATWFRRTRALTQADVLRQRYGAAFEQLIVYLFAFTTPLFLAVNLLGAATFVSAMFGLPLIGMIVVIGAVATLSSLLGGRWGCMATGFLQALILLSVTVAVAALCWQRFGGGAGLVAAIDAQGLVNYFRLLRPADAAPAVAGVLGVGSFTATWLAGLTLHAIIMAFSLATACRFHAARDERAARRAATLAGCLLLAGSVAWGIPAITARGVLSDRVEATQGLRSPQDSAYVVAALEVLPAGLAGLVAVSMIAATMSVLDGAQAFVAGNLANNGWPAARRWVLSAGEASGRERLLVARACNLLVGLAVVALAAFAALAESNKGMFDLMLELMGSIGVPIHVPLSLGLLWRSAPTRAAWAGLLGGFATSIAFLLLGLAGFSEPLWQTKVATIAFVSSATFAFAAIVVPSRSESERLRVARFFYRLREPVENPQDGCPSAQFAAQQRAIGAFGGFIALLVAGTGFVPGQVESLPLALAIAAPIAAVAALLFLSASARR